MSWRWLVKRSGWVTVAVGAPFAFAPVAGAVAPSLQSVGAQSLHPTATFSAPRADYATIYLASKPDRATNGAFLEENIEELASMTTSELQSGKWTDQQQIDPGTYYVMLKASPDLATCLLNSGGVDPTCADGYSNVVKLVVPTPPIRYTGAATVESYAKRVELQLTARPLGQKQVYRVCYATKVGRRCVSGVLDGYDWSSSRGTDDLVSVNAAKLLDLTTFTWYVSGKKVASRSVRIRRS